MAKDKNYKHYRILDFNPDICGVEDGYIVLFSPYKLIVDGVLVIPDGIRMPDGSVLMIFDTMQHPFSGTCSGSGKLLLPCMLGILI